MIPRRPLAILLLPALLLLAVAPTAAATHENDPCTPWLPSVDGREKACVDAESTVCPVYVYHDGQWLDYRLCLIPRPAPGGPLPDPALP